MRKLGAVLLTAVLGAMAVSPARAESEIAVNIPFDFVAGKNTMKAGAYKIEKLQSGVLSLKSDGQERFVLIVQGGATINDRGHAYVVFNRFGNENFLTKVALSDDDNYDLPQSKHEKQLEKQTMEGGLEVIESR